MSEIVLTDHFQERWLQRVGGAASPRAIAEILANSVIVQPCMNLFRPDGRLYRVCAIYWHPDLDLIIKTDECHNRAVTVLSRGNWRGGK